MSLAITGMLMGGWSGPPASTAYFPLESDRRWAHAQVTAWENNTVKREPLVLTALGSGKPESDSGVYRVATKTNLLRRHADYPSEIRHTHKPVPMTDRIDALADKLATRAGSFGNCIRVQGTAVVKLFADPVVGFKDRPRTTTDGCCKGVGLVQVERTEPAHSTFLAGGKVSLGLLEWN